MYIIILHHPTTAATEAVAFYLRKGEKKSVAIGQDTAYKQLYSLSTIIACERVARHRTRRSGDTVIDSK